MTERRLAFDLDDHVRAAPEELAARPAEGQVRLFAESVADEGVLDRRRLTFVGTTATTGHEFTRSRLDRSMEPGFDRLESFRTSCTNSTKNKDRQDEEPTATAWPATPGRQQEARSSMP